MLAGRQFDARDTSTSGSAIVNRTFVKDLLADPNSALAVGFTAGIPADIAERLRAIGAEIDPELQLRRIVPLSQFYDDLRSVWRSVAWALGLVTASVLLLSAAGVQALMSFTIAQRTREIGIRATLGAPPRQLLFGIL